MLVTPRERRRRRRAFILILMMGAGVTWYSATSTVAEVKPKEEVVAVTETPIIIITPTLEPTPTEAVMPKYNIPLSEDLQTYIWDICQEYNIEYELFLALIKQESNFNPKAVNKNTNGTCDLGIAQLNSVNHSYHSSLAGVSEKDFDPYNPYMNTKAALGHLRDLYESWSKHGYTGDALDYTVCGAYNRGTSGMQKYIASRGIKTDYAKNIIYYRNKLKENGGL